MDLNLYTRSTRFDSSQYLLKHTEYDTYSILDPSSLKEINS